MPLPHEVEALLGLRLARRGSEIQALVKWKGLCHRKCTWVSLAELKNAARDMVQQFLQEQPTSTAHVHGGLHTFGIKHCWTVPADVITERRGDAQRTEYSVLWRGLPASAASWESLEDEELTDVVERYRARVAFAKSLPARKDWTAPLTSCPATLPCAVPPSLLPALNRLRSCWTQTANVLLVDAAQRGLARVLVGFLVLLAQDGHSRGPHVVCVPRSCVAHYTALVRLAAPMLSLAVWDHTPQKEAQPAPPANIVLVPLECVADAALSSVAWQTISVSELHALTPDVQSTVLQKLVECGDALRIVLSSVSLQSDLEQLARLLQFVDASSAATPSTLQASISGKSEDEVEAHLQQCSAHLLYVHPEDEALCTEYCVHSDMSPLQRKLCAALLLRNRQTLQMPPSAARTSALLQLYSSLVTVGDHPHVFDAGQQEAAEAVTTNSLACDKVGSVAWTLIHSSGKLLSLDLLMVRLRAEHRRVAVLVHSGKVMDILEDFLSARKFSFIRVGSSLDVAECTQRLARFNKPDSSVFCMLLSTDLGHLSSQLTAADTFILYNTDFSPECPIEAVGNLFERQQQHRTMVYRLILRLSVDEPVLSAARDSLLLRCHGIVSTPHTHALPTPGCDVEYALRHAALGLLAAADPAVLVLARPAPAVHSAVEVNPAGGGAAAEERDIVQQLLDRSDQGLVAKALGLGSEGTNLSVTPYVSSGAVPVLAGRGRPLVSPQEHAQSNSVFWDGVLTKLASESAEEDDAHAKRARDEVSEYAIAVPLDADGSDDDLEENDEPVSDQVEDVVAQFLQQQQALLDRACTAGQPLPAVPDLVCTANADGSPRYTLQLLDGHNLFEHPMLRRLSNADRVDVAVELRQSMEEWLAAARRRLAAAPAASASGTAGSPRRDPGAEGEAKSKRKRARPRQVLPASAAFSSPAPNNTNHSSSSSSPAAAASAVAQDGPSSTPVTAPVAAAAAPAVAARDKAAMAIDPPILPPIPAVAAFTPPYSAALPAVSPHASTVEIKGFNLEQRHAFVSCIGQYGFEGRWQLICQRHPALQAKTEKQLQDYALLFVQHLCEAETRAAEYADGMPKDGVRRTLLLLALGVLRLIHEKVEECRPDGDETVLNALLNPGEWSPTQAWLDNFHIADGHFTPLQAQWVEAEGDITAPWTRDHDFRLLAGIVRHGYGAHEAMMNDAALGIPTLRRNPFPSEIPEGGFEMARFAVQRLQVLERALAAEFQINTAVRMSIQVDPHTPELKFFAYFSNLLLRLNVLRNSFGRQAAQGNKEACRQLRKELKVLDTLLAHAKEEVVRVPSLCMDSSPLHEVLGLTEADVLREAAELLKQRHQRKASRTSSESQVDGGAKAAKQ
eukprot:m.295111 g.295111  ORF g.295111 m.295111 type:complete len:1360 (-) comp22968_c1_seq3:383-4462(-)